MQSLDFKRFMFEQKIKQKALANYLGVSEGYISQIISGRKQLSEENLSKVLNNPFGWDTSILEGKEENDPKLTQPQNVVDEKPEERTMIDRLFLLVESQRKDIEALITLVKEKDEKIDELLNELNARKGETAPSAGRSSDAGAI